MSSGTSNKQIVVAAGCFWGVEDTLGKVDGVVKTAVGYTGGHTENPSYKEVCSGSTGHAEAVLVEFDESKVSLAQILDKFFEIHDPTQLNRQGFDFGSQYRSEIFYGNEEQLNEANMAKERSQKIYSGRVVTRISKKSDFFMAEDYHQKYFSKKRSF